ncbi:MAG TPA: hypothetical protein VFV03_08795 [Solirubrobacteraceae bacterium]|nr:hypothetical protein [Solirubrobacteraceae bacterium]
MTLFATTLPENSNDGYVAAAYIVFFALVLIYVAIMAIRLSRVERSVRELREQAARQHDGSLGRPHPEDTPPIAGDRRREREIV